MKSIRHLFFIVTVLLGSLLDRIKGRRIAYCAALLPTETSRGTQSMLSDSGVTVAYFNALVKAGSDDRHFALVTAANDIPLGILFNDSVEFVDANSVPKQIALFGLYAESLPGVAAGAIAQGAEIVADLTTPGRVKQLPATTGTYLVVGRARQAASGAGEPVSIIHCVPRTAVVP